MLLELQSRVPCPTLFLDIMVAFRMFWKRYHGERQGRAAWTRSACAGGAGGRYRRRADAAPPRLRAARFAPPAVPREPCCRSSPPDCTLCCESENYLEWNSANDSCIRMPLILNYEMLVCVFENGTLKMTVEYLYIYFQFEFRNMCF